MMQKYKNLSDIMFFNSNKTVLISNLESDKTVLKKGTNKV